LTIWSGSSYGGPDIRTGQEIQVIRRNTLPEKAPIIAASEADWHHHGAPEDILAYRIALTEEFA
jgi:hypothetical protein